MYSIRDYKRNIKLTIKNTEELYRQALEVKDRHWMSDEIDALYLATWAQINEDAGENVAPQLVTDHDVRDVRDAVIETVTDLQLEAQR